MKLAELIQNTDLTTDFSKFHRPNRPNGMPSLDEAKLQIAGLINPRLSTPTEGGHTLLLTYKGNSGGVVSAAELEQGAEWSILQVQGAKSKKSYRVGSCYDWQRCLGSKYRDLSEDDQAEVERITMPHTHGITNITDSPNLEGAIAGYAAVRGVLKMRNSEEEGKWIVDITRSNAHEILSASTLQKAKES